LGLSWWRDDKAQLNEAPQRIKSCAHRKTLSSPSGGLGALWGFNGGESMTTKTQSKAQHITITLGDAVRGELSGSMEGALCEAEKGWSSYACGAAAILSLSDKLGARGKILLLSLPEAEWLADHLQSCEERLENPEDRPLGRAGGKVAEKIDAAIAKCKVQS
jgi:hypothetical protein